MHGDQARPGDWLQSPFWQGPVQIISIERRADHDIVTVHSADGRVSRGYILTPDDWVQASVVAPADRLTVSFTGDPQRFALAIQAYLLRNAHSVDPFAALNASRVDPLPHQYEAVYEHLLARPIVRALLAHDAGAGKTIMAGLLIKELRRRQGARRVLIVTPAGLTGQWRRELLTKFAETFSIVDRDFMLTRGLDDLDVWRATDSAITSLDFAKTRNLRRALESVEWDLVIVDEAHKMAAYKRPNGAVERTQAYRLGEILSRRSTHFLLATATPHKGDPDNYRLLIALIDPQWGELSAFAPAGNPVVLRRSKEEMRKPNGDLLYPERIVDTLPFNLSVQEGDLLEQTQNYVRERYRKAVRGNQASAAFALITLGRRMASSPYALRESLKRIRAATETRMERMPHLSGDGQQPEPGGDETEDWDELTEQERWRREAAAEASVAGLAEGRHLQTELTRLDGLIAAATRIIEQGEQAKIRELRHACDLWVGERHNQMIVFTEFKDTLNYLVGCLAGWGYTTTQIQGDMGLADRRKAERAFWAGDAQVLVATEAAGEGINLQVCHVMVNFDLPWNPGRLEQRMGRIHRYGQRADKVYVFNLLARYSMEDDVKAALIEKLKVMRKDLGDKVFDVVGRVVWGREFREILTRVALGEANAAQEAEAFLTQAEGSIADAVNAERRVSGTSEPLDLLRYQQQAATFAAHRLSPEDAEGFFRRAIPFVGGSIRVSAVPAGDGRVRPVLDVTVPADLAGGRPRRLRGSFWPEVATDDDLEPDAVQFIAPGHWLFERLLDTVIERCQSDLAEGAVFCDLDPEGRAPYLLWFVRSQIRNGLDQPVADMLACARHQADLERVRPEPMLVLEGLDPRSGRDVIAVTRQVSPMLTGQGEVLNQCVNDRFVPDLGRWREHQGDALARDRTFLQTGLSAMTAQLGAMAMDAYIAGDIAQGDQLTEQSEKATRQLDALLARIASAEQLLLVAPDVLGVALVQPTPLQLAVGEAGSDRGPRMQRDPEVEQAAMDHVMAYEVLHDRIPRDVHQGNSWDIESDDRQGVLLRYIEVKGRGPQEADEVWLTEPEWQAARRLGDRYWLYIVRLADSVMWIIQNPFAKLQPKELKRWIVPIADVEPHAEMLRLSG